MIYHIVFAAVAVGAYLSFGLIFVINSHRALMSPENDDERELAGMAAMTRIEPAHLRKYGMRALPFIAVVLLVIIIPVSYVESKLRWKKP